MRYIGLDLAQTTSHKALVIDEGGQVITPVMSVKTSAISLELLFQHAREGTPADEPLIVVMEPTGMTWFPTATAPITTSAMVSLAKVRPSAAGCEAASQNSRESSRTAAIPNVIQSPFDDVVCMMKPPYS